MANIAEGFARSSRLKFIRFLDFARSSSVELQSHFHLARAEGYISDEEFDEIYSECARLRNALTALIRYLKTKGAPR